MEVIARRILYQLTGNWLRVNCGILWGTAWTIIKMRQDKGGCCSQIFHPIAKEFQKDKFSLSHQPVDDFLKSQWQTSERSYLWLFYRWGLAICFSVGVLGSLIQEWHQGLWFIYLTHWGFLLCMIISLLGAILVTIKYFKPDKFGDDSKIFKIYWACHWSTLVLAIVITFMYWLFIYPRDDSKIFKIYWACHWSTLVLAIVITFMYWLFIYPHDNASASDLYNLWAHGFNSILMVLDHMLVAFPSRLMHFIFPLSLGIIYGLFTLVYYLAGGVDPQGNRYIYEVLDWSQPGWTVLTSFGCWVLVFVFSFLLFCLYKLRSTIYRKCMNSKLSLNF